MVWPAYAFDEDVYLGVGVLKFGEGNWAEIHSWFGVSKTNRGNVSLKDRWRTLKRKGRLTVKLFPFIST